jgi:hypothetical protein
MRTPLIAVLTAFLFSCTHTHVASRRYMGVLPESPVPPEIVSILDREPPVPFRQIGEIRVEWPGFRTKQDVLKDAAIQRALRHEAGRLGADSVVVLHFLHRSGYGSGVVDPAPPVQLIAMAISTRPAADRRRGLQLTRGDLSPSAARR